MNYKRKNKFLNKKEKYENEFNINLENRKKERNNEKLKSNKESINIISFFIDDFILNKNLQNNLEIKRRYIIKHIEKNKFKFININIISFFAIKLNIIFFFLEKLN